MIGNALLSENSSQEMTFFGVSTDPSAGVVSSDYISKAKANNEGTLLFLQYLDLRGKYGSIITSKGQRLPGRPFCSQSAHGKISMGTAGQSVWDPAISRAGYWNL